MRPARSTQEEEIVNNMAFRYALIVLIIGKLSAAELMIPNGTKLSARLEQTISSATADQGQQVQLSITEAVKVNGVVVIPQGSQVLGSIVTAQEKRTMGRTGKLDFSVDKVRAADGEYVPLRYTMQKKEGGSKGMSTGIITAGAAVLFWPAAPFFLLRKGKDVTINKGIVLEVFTDQDHTMTPQFTATAGGGAAQGQAPMQTPQQQLQQQPNLNPQGNQVMLASQPQGSASNPAVELATVNITSDMPGAEVEIDKVFIGSTPTASKLAPGMHKITVKHGANTWSRDMMVQPGGNVTVNAILKGAK